VEEIANYGQCDELAVARSAVSLAHDELDQLSLHPAPASQELLDSDKHKAREIGRTAGMDSTHSLRHILGIISWVKAARRWNRLPGNTPKGRRRLERFIRSHPTQLYLGSIASLSLGLMIIPLAFAPYPGRQRLKSCSFLFSP